MGRRERNRPPLRTESRSVASAAADDAHVFFKLPALNSAVRAAVSRKQMRDDPLEAAAIFVAAGAAAPSERDMLTTCAPKPKFLQLGGKLFPGRFENRPLAQAANSLDRNGDALLNGASPATHFAPLPRPPDAAVFERAA